MEFDKTREGFRSCSEYVGWLIRTRYDSINPSEYLKTLDKQESELTDQVNKIKKKREEAIKNLEFSKEIEIVKSKKRQDAIKIIQKKIIEEGILPAEQIAKNWGMMLNCQPTELLFEAIKNNKENADAKRLASGNIPEQINRKVYK